MKRYLISRAAGLVVTGVGYGDDARIAAAFASVWRSLPYYARRALSGFWRRERARFGGMVRVPRVELLPSRSAFTHAPDGSKAEIPIYASVTEGGRVIEIAAPDCGELPPARLRFLIAHELAHVYFRAKGEPVPRCFGEQEDEEYYADQHAREWLNVDNDGVG